MRNNSTLVKAKRTRKERANHSATNSWANGYQIVDPAPHQHHQQFDPQASYDNYSSQQHLPHSQYSPEYSGEL